MIELLARLFIRDSRHTDDPRVRAAYGTLCSAVAIALNILLAAAKFVVGTLAGSVSITADAMNNLSDVGSGALTLVGFRLSGKKPDLEHPFGHGRIEYVMGLVIAGIILYAGIDALRGAAGKLLHPEAMEFTWAAVAVLVLSILVKVYMSAFYRRIGRKIGSTTMEMSGADALNDTVSTALTLVCLLVYKFTGLDLDAYAGIVVAGLLHESVANAVLYFLHILQQHLVVYHHFHFGEFRNDRREVLHSLRGAQHVGRHTVAHQQPLLQEHVVVERLMQSGGSLLLRFHFVSRFFRSFHQIAERLSYRP